MKTKMLLLFCLTLTTKGIWAQDEVKELPGEVFRELQFNFATPGARASGMGRAFIGLAEDATAAVSNPAGLLNLTRPQVYFEGKLTELRSRRLAERGAFNTLEVSNFYQTTVSFSFINFAIPVGDRVVLAFTRHEFLNFEERFVLGDRAFPGDCKNDWNGNGVPDAGGSGDCTPSLFAVRGQGEESARVDFRGESFGGSIAYQLYETLSIGATISVERAKGFVETSDYAGFSDSLRCHSITIDGGFADLESDCPSGLDGDAILTGSDTLSNKFGDQFTIDPDLNISRYSIDDRDFGLGLIVGALFKPTPNFWELYT